MRNEEIEVSDSTPSALSHPPLNLYVTNANCIVGETAHYCSWSDRIYLYSYVLCRLLNIVCIARLVISTV